MASVISVAAVAMAVALAPSAWADGTATLPADPAAHGYIGLCDAQGHNVVGGTVDSVPFVWKAVASVRPPAQYTGAGQNASLYVYQPRPDTAPAYWSGQALTAGSFYDAKSQPTAQSTYKDGSLRAVVRAYPPMVDGLYVLRMQFGKQNYGIYNSTYPTTTIQVSGNHWRVVRGGTVDCSTARATSLEEATGVATKQQTVPHGPYPPVQTVAAGPSGGPITAPVVPAGDPGAASVAPGGSSSTSTAPDGVSNSVGPGSSTTGAAAPAVSDGTSTPQAGTTTSSSGVPVWVWLVVAAAVVMVGAAVSISRTARRRPPPDA